MGIFDNIFGKKKENSTKNQNTKTPSNVNFDLLVEKARTTNTTTDLNKLYSSFLDLNEWHFIVSKNASIENPKPFVGIVDEKPWLFVFTDAEKANTYAKQFGGFLEENGNTLVLRIPKESSLNMVKQLGARGVYGIRINEGENGWFTDVSGLFNIIEHLNN